MMANGNGSNIQSNSTAAQDVASKLREGMGDYLSLELKKINDTAPVSGNSTHDGLSESVTGALTSWESLVDADAQSIVNTAQSINSSDADLANKMLGLGN